MTKVDIHKKAMIEALNSSDSGELRNIEIKEVFDFLYQHEKDLTSGQVDFINGLKKYFTRNKILSEKQSKALFDIKKYLNKDEQPRFSRAFKTV